MITKNIVMAASVIVIIFATICVVNSTTVVSPSLNNKVEIATPEKDFIFWKVAHFLGINFKDSCYYTTNKEGKIIYFCS